MKVNNMNIDDKEKQLYKCSSYNYFIPMDDGYVLAYNALSNALARVPEDKHKVIEAILANPDAPVESNVEDFFGLRDDLLKGLFLVESDFDEIGLLKMRNRIGRFNDDALALTIVPTMACNCSCVYCFEKPSAAAMTKEVEEAVIKFAREKIKGKSGLFINWFGGEVTLALDSTRRLISAFREICKENDIEFQSMGIITNGVLLNRKTALELKEMNITHAQITLDGPPEVHDQRRTLRGGQGTFAAILSNIKEVCDILDLNVRVNVDRQNSSKLDGLFEILKEAGLDKKIRVYFGQVREFTSNCADFSSMCYTTREHSELVVGLMEKARAKGFTQASYPLPSHFGYCLADSVRGFVVGPTGLLFKCWSEVGEDPKTSVGSVFDDNMETSQLNNLSRYMNWDPFTNNECLKCGYLPICGGGCPYLGMQTGAQKSCTDFRYNLKEMLLMKYEELKQQMANKSNKQ